MRQPLRRAERTRRQFTEQLGRGYSDAMAQEPQNEPKNQGGGADPREIAKFDRMAAEFWDPAGPMAPLHKMQPARLAFFVDQIAAEFGRPPQRPRPFEGLRLLDVGCGGGLLSEAMTRLGADVTGVDASEAGVAVARAHAEAMALPVSYRVCTAETVAQEVEAGEQAPFDVVIASEVIEHVENADGFLSALSAVAAPGGLVLLSTLNRTAASFMLGIVAAEHILRWLPPGTHDWRRFVPPGALAAGLAAAGLRPVARAGFVYDPFADKFRVDPDNLMVNYAMAAVKTA